jgi:hypothetical protein
MKVLPLVARFSTLIHFLSLSLRYEEQVKKSLEYFAKLRKAQLVRKAAKMTGWQMTFLDSKTWRNLRITCRGFFAYCRYCIKFADTIHIRNYIPLFKAVSPAHSTTSILEAGFALARRMGGEDPRNCITCGL